MLQRTVFFNTALYYKGRQCKIITTAKGLAKLHNFFSNLSTFSMLVLSD